MPERSIFIVVKGSGVGKVFPGLEAAIGRDIAAFIPYEPLDREFVLLALREHCAGIIGEARGHIPGLSREALLGLWLDVPPLAEQRRIVQAIHKAEERLEETLIQLRRATTSAVELRTSIFSEAFSGSATEVWREDQGPQQALSSQQVSEPRDSPPGNIIRGRFGIALGVPTDRTPPGWGWTRLGEVADLRTGHTPSRRKPEYWNGDIPWLGIVDARENYGKVINDTRQHVTLLGIDNSSAEILPVGSVCLSRTASIGYVVVTGTPMATSQDFLNWTCGDLVDRDWLLRLFIAERDSWQNFGKGSTHKTIYMEDAAQIHVLLPPLSEQLVVVDFITTSMQRVEEILNNVDSSEEAALGTRSRMVEAALQGELQTADETDEPADILLAQLERDVEVTRAEEPSEMPRETDASDVSVERLIHVVDESDSGLSPERLFSSAGYKADAVDVFFTHIKNAVMMGAIRYDAANDLVIADEA